MKKWAEVLVAVVGLTAAIVRFAVAIRDLNEDDPEEELQDDV